MLDEFIEKIQDTMVSYLIEKLKETGNTVWLSMDDKEKERFIKVLKSLIKLPLDSIFDEDRKKELKRDFKTALNVISIDFASILLEARNKTDDKVVVSAIDFILSFLSGK